MAIQKRKGRGKAERTWNRIVALATEHPEWHIKEYAKALGVSYHTVHAIMRGHDWAIDGRERPRQTVTDEDRAEVIAQYKAGASYKAMEDWFGLPSSRLKQILGDCMDRHTEWTPAKELEMVELILQGYLTNEIAEKMHLRPAQVSGRRQKLMRSNKTGGGWNVIRLLLQRKIQMN